MLGNPACKGFMFTHFEGLKYFCEPSDSLLELEPRFLDFLCFLCFLRLFLCFLRFLSVLLDEDEEDEVDDDFEDIEGLLLPVLLDSSICSATIFFNTV